MKNRIRSPFVDTKRDREINNSLRRRLDHESHGVLRRIHTNVQQGVVVLSGFAATEADIERASEIALRCPHVDSVLNHVELLAANALPSVVH